MCLNYDARQVSLFLGFSLLLLGWSLSAVPAQTALQQAPLSSQFLAYQQQPAPATRSANGHPLGFIPSPHGMANLAVNLPTRLGASTLPATYDLRALERLSPIENQGDAGCCWAFATCGSLESCLLSLDPPRTYIFSENNMKNDSGFDGDPNTTGGNYDMSTAYLSRWSGPVLASQDPYNPDTTTSPAGLSPAKHVQNVIYIPGRTSSLDNTTLKQAIMQYGAVAISLYYSDDASAFNAATSAYYYYSSSVPAPNHGVDIVGWDDNYAASNFTVGNQPPGNGAFIARNSWGTDWGDAGYFYISYYDCSAAVTSNGGENAVFEDGEPADNYLNNYQYDPLGWVTQIGNEETTTFWGANVFTATANEDVAAVGLYRSNRASVVKSRFIRRRPMGRSIQPVRQLP